MLQWIVLDGIGLDRIAIITEDRVFFARACVCVRESVFMYIRMYVCMYVRTYVCTYVCVYIYIYTCIYSTQESSIWGQRHRRPLGGNLVAGCAGRQDAKGAVATRRAAGVAGGVAEMQGCGASHITLEQGGGGSHMRLESLEAGSKSKRGNDVAGQLPAAKRRALSAGPLGPPVDTAEPVPGEEGGDHDVAAEGEVEARLRLHVVITRLLGVNQDSMLVHTGISCVCDIHIRTQALTLSLSLSLSHRLGNAWQCRCLPASAPRRGNGRRGNGSMGGTCCCCPLADAELWNGAR